ncbi:uncharacterized protein MKZ38_002409 [Zalerion maritima]|uniref:Ribosome biogenesis protein SLX9 n=1 Tax=Zalerion maritima TaxID=339359 RepID=A0AAD5RNZ4_9PEZI|nr:uncharacterized protein MKZ38_002409 [Zalerion maritima]
MAPTAPSKRRSMRARALGVSTSAGDAASIAHSVPSAPPASSSSKKAKRIAKHNALVSRIRKTAPFGKSAVQKRRRPNKKLASNLSSLLDVLPSLDKGDEDGDGSGPSAYNGGNGAEDLQSRIIRDLLKHKSLKIKPGALKKKEKIARWEMSEFGKNLAALQKVEEHAPIASQQSSLLPSQPNQATAPTANRWAELRKRISSAMDQNPAFRT